jgi:hypothetical protein
MKIFLAGALGATLLCGLTGCVQVAAVEKHDAQPDPSSGYVAGMFSREALSGVAFVVRNEASGKEYNLPLGEDTTMPRAVEGEVVAIRLPPGQYEVPAWVAYATVTKERMLRKDVTNLFLSAPFEVRSNTVTFLGKFRLTGGNDLYRLIWRITPEPIRSAAAHEAFGKTYPALDALTFACRLCVPEPDPLLQRGPRRKARIPYLLQSGR